MKYFFKKVVNLALQKIKKIEDFDFTFLTGTTFEGEILQLHEIIELFPEKEKKAVEDLIQVYIIEFFTKHDFYISELEWINKYGLLSISDYFLDFADIKIDIDTNARKKQFFEWYDFAIENDNRINYNSWRMGLRPENLKK